MRTAQQMFEEACKAYGVLARSEPYRQGFLAWLLSMESRNYAFTRQSCRHAEGTAEHDAYWSGVHKAGSLYESEFITRTATAVPEAGKNYLTRQTEAGSESQDR